MRGLSVFIGIGVVAFFSTANGDSDSDEDVESFNAIALELHNKYRSKYGSPALKLDTDLAERAVACAQYYAEKNEIDWKCPESNEKGFGTSLIQMTNSGFSMSTVVTMAIEQWYSGRKSYDFTNHQGSGTGTAGFINLVWKATKKFGMGCYAKPQSILCLAFYYPPGNVQGYFEDNISPKVKRKQ